MSSSPYLLEKRRSPERCSLEEHLRKYGQPDDVTSLLWKSVPLLKHSGWYVDAIEEGFCRSVFPATAVTTNQHHTLQGATYLLAGDYTGGIALGSLFLGAPIFGVHAVRSGFGNNLWLSHVNLKYTAPAYDDMAVTCRVEKER